MRILHVVTGLNVGGAELQLCGLTERLKEQGYTQKIVSLLPDGPLSSGIRSRGIELVALGMRQSRPDFSKVSTLRREIEQFRPTVIQSWMYHACIYSSLAAGFGGSQLPQLWSIHHSNLSFAANNASTLAAIAACRVLSRRKQVHIAYCAEASRRSHESIGYDKRRGMFVPNGYDTDRFVRRPGARERIRAQFGLDADVTAVGLVARFDPIKDHATFLAAAALAKRNSSKELRFVLIGEGMDSSNTGLASLIEQNKLATSVVLAGRRDDMESVYSALDILTLSSRGEAFPNVLCEAMLCGIPCVSTNVGDCAIILGETGFLAPAGAPAALGEAIGQAAALDPAELQQRGTAARERIVSRYSSESFLLRHVSIYNELAGVENVVFP